MSTILKNKVEQQIKNMKINILIPNVKTPYIELGAIHSVGEFFRVTTESIRYFEIYLNGVKLDIQLQNLPPSPDQITIYSNGLAQLHPSAAGKVLTGKITFQGGFLATEKKNIYVVKNNQ